MAAGRPLRCNIALLSEPTLRLVLRERPRLGSVPFVLALGCTLSGLHLLAAPGRVGTTAFAVASLAFLATAVSHALAWRGRRWTVSFFAIAFTVSAAIEVVGVRFGVPFGSYRYTPLLGWTLAGVPLLVPLAWSMMAYPCYVLARRTTSHPAGGPLLAALALTAWDLLLDPVMVAHGAWSWSRYPGDPQAVPTTNTLGWLATALLTMALAWRLPPRAVDESVDDRVAYGLYGGMALVTALQALVSDQPVVAATGLAAMGGMASLPLLARLAATAAPRRLPPLAPPRLALATAPVAAPARRHPDPRTEPSGCARRRSAFVLLAALVASPAGAAVQLLPEAAAAFDRYAHLTEARLDADLGRGRFLWLDTLPPAERAAVVARLRGGELIMRRQRTRDGGKAIDAPGALIHHWLGLVFIPRASLRATRAMAQDYDHHDELFAQVIKRSRLLSHRGDELHVYQRFELRRILTGVVDTESHVVYQPVSSTRLRIRARSIRVAEVLDHGTPEERQAPVGRDSGFLWRVNSYWAIEELADGVYLQVEWVSLSRRIPPALAALIRPIVDGLTRDTLETTLLAARQAVRRDAAPRSSP